MKNQVNFLENTKGYIAIFHTSKASWASSAKTELKLITNKGFDAEYFGAEVNIDEDNKVVLDQNGEELCTIEEYNSDSGSLNLDHEYNTYTWLPVAELDEEQIASFVYGNNGISFEFHELWLHMGQPESIKILMDLEARKDDIAYAVYHSMSDEDLVKQNIIEFNEETEEYELY